LNKNLKILTKKIFLYNIVGNFALVVVSCDAVRKTETAILDKLAFYYSKSLYFQTLI